MPVIRTFSVILSMSICFVLLQDTNASLESNSLLKTFDDTPPSEGDPNETNVQLDIEKILSTNNLEAMKNSYSEFPLLLRPYKDSGIIGSITETIKNLAEFFGITSEEAGSAVLNIKYPTDPLYKNIPEANFNSSQLLKQILGYPVEEHTVQTKDGYILSLQRIPAKTSEAPVVLLLHGFLESSKIFLINSHANQNLPTILSDTGFDVWLANFRGSTYSQKHVNYSRDDPKFWRYSWSEQALVDLPTMIDFVLQKTDQSNLSLVGHSLGTSHSFILLSTLPNYNSKVRVLTALAPICKLSHVTNPLTIIYQFADLFTPLSSLMGVRGNLLPLFNIFHSVFPGLCSVSAFNAVLCQPISSTFFSVRSRNINVTRLPVLLAEFPVPSSTFILAHFAQQIRDASFQFYDFGRDNKRIYNQAKPPRFQVENIKTPIALYSSAIDVLSDQKDIVYLRKTLRTIIEDIVVDKEEQFSHYDFVIGLSAQTLIYPAVIKTLTYYSTTGALVKTRA